MKKSTLFKLALVCLMTVTSVTRAAIITVNTADNTDFTAGKTNLVTAINSLHDGDTIQFAISGAGVHRLVTPAPVLGAGGGGGYPEITNNDVTIDGFSQAGSSANSNTILATNNAVYKIVLDSTAGGTHVWDIGGFGTSESGIFVVSGHRFHLQGVSMVSAFGDSNDSSPKIYGVAFGRGATNGWISGCWMGVDADGTTVGAMNNAVSGYGSSTTRNNGIVIGVAAGAASTAIARAQQNVICAGGIPLAIEGASPRISGNRIGVLPDGKTTLNYDDFFNAPAGFCALIEVGRRPGGTLIGTDGDGVNDAEERNIFGAINLSGDGAFIDFYGTGGDGGVGSATNIVIAGNYFGVGIDGNKLRFADGSTANNSQRICNGVGSGNPIRSVRIGSDFDGVSDSLEANVIQMNYDFDTLYPTPSSGGLPPFFMGIDAGERVSLRGNVMVGNNLAPYSFADGTGGRLVTFTNIESKFMDTNGSIIPTLTGSTTATNHLTGTCALGISNTVDHLFYTNIIVDVYVADPEGLTNGAKFDLQEIGGVSGYGFPQGKTYLASYVVDGGSDLDPTAGFFDFDIGSLHLVAGTKITVIANYSADPPGTHNARTHSSNFSKPLILGIPQVINVTTDASSGAGSLAEALANVQDGFIIKFNIAGAGAHYIVTPAGGYPVITANSVTIDGYSQPGAVPNTNTFLSSNSAKLKIVIDSRNGEGTSNPGPGFGAGETGALFVMGSGCTIQGLCFLGAGNTVGTDDKAAIDIGNTANNTHVSGCWIGVDVDGVTLAPFDRGPTAFGDIVNAAPSWPHGTVIGVRAGRADVAGTRAQQNVIVGCFIDVFLEGADMRISGNKLNVLPDGLHDIDVTATGYGIEAIIETGRENNNMVVGTDGDGLNDAEERNVFGGVSIAGDGNIIEIYGNNGSDTTAANTNIIIAGNYFGVAVDGVTRFTNSMTIVDAFHNQNGVNASVQFGSDFNGVSDAIEGNLIYMNNPFTTIFPDPSSSPPPPSLFNADAGARVSVRGNTMVNNGLVPFSYADGSGGRLANFTNYEAPFFETASPIIPVLLTKSSSRHLLGVAAKAVGIHTNVFIDVYLEDLEGWTNGMKFGLSELVAGGVTNGFPQGKTFKGSFSLGNNFPGGNFDLDITSLGLSPGAFVTAAANYSADPPGTARGRAHTSNFANPVTLLAPIVITSATKTGNTVTLNWTGGAAPYTLQKRSPITGAWGNVATGIGGTSASDTSATGSEAYYRVLN